MLVLFIPTSNGNPYQAELSRNLNEHGINVIMRDESSVFPILRVILGTGKPDILHLHWTHTRLKSRNLFEHLIKGIRLISEILFLKILGVKIVWTVHNIVDHESEENRITTIIHRFLSNISNSLIVHCEQAKLAVKQTYKPLQSTKKKICVVPHGNYISSYQNNICREKARSLLGIEDSETVFGFFGNIRAYKGIFDLVHAFQELNKSGTRLLLAGKAGTRAIEKELYRIANKDRRISVYLGFIPDESIQIYLNCTDVMVLPFQKVLTSGSVLLAMSYGKPVIAPASGCLQEILDHNTNFLYKPNDVTSLICAMKKSIKADLPKLGKYNFHIATLANWRISAERTADVYRTI